MYPHCLYPPLVCVGDSLRPGCYSQEEVSQRWEVYVFVQLLSNYSLDCVRASSDRGVKLP